MQIYNKMLEAILEGDAQLTIELTKKALVEKYPPQNILNNGFIKGIELVADKFNDDSLLIPEALMSTRAINAGIEAIKPYLKDNKKKKSKNVKIVMGVVSGDLHDIGKNIVKTLISTLDVEIIDLGINVESDKFIDTIKKEDPSILMISALLTTTMPEVKEVIDRTKKEKLRENITIFVGGRPMSDKFCKYVGADYFIPNPIELMEFIKQNLSRFKK